MRKKELHGNFHCQIVFFVCFFRSGEYRVNEKLRIVDVFPKCDVTAQISTSVSTATLATAYSVRNANRITQLYGCVLIAECVVPIAVVARDVTMCK